MKIVEIREKTVPISSPIRNAYIDFSKMTLSLVAVITDVVRDGKPVVGYGFNSNGRYGQGKLMRERFMPSHPGGRARQLLDAAASLDPHKVWDTMFKNEKPGGHGERSVAIGTIDMAVWDAVAKIEASRCSSLLADRYGDGTVNRKVFVYAAGGYYYPGKDDSQAEGRDAQLHRSRLHRREDEDRRRIARRGPAPHRLHLSMLQDGQRLCVDANGRFDLDTAIAYAKALSQYDLFWYEEAGDPLDYELQAALRNYYKNPMATGENLFSMQDARNLIRYGGMRPDRDWLQFDCALLRPGGIPAHAGDAEAARLVGQPLHAPRRPPDVAEHRGRPGPGRQRVVPRPVPALRRLPRRREGGQQLRDAARPARHRLRRQGRPVSARCRRCRPDPQLEETDMTPTSESSPASPWPPPPPGLGRLPGQAHHPGRAVRGRRARATRSHATWPRRCASRWARPSSSTTQAERAAPSGRRRSPAPHRTATPCWCTTSAWRPPRPCTAS
jgi:L-alanine-DL-glutamate epimerase-like enolase superfamily enzyme